MQTLEENRLQRIPYPLARFRRRVASAALLLSGLLLLVVVFATEADAHPHDDGDIPADETSEALRASVLSANAFNASEYEDYLRRSSEALRAALRAWYPRSTSILLSEYGWMERSDSVISLQRVLGIERDGVYGPATRKAHAEMLTALWLSDEGVPDTSTVSRPPAHRRSMPKAYEDIPTEILRAIQSLWPEDQWLRAQRVAWCESRYRLDAKNPTSSASGLFQTLAPWTRDAGTGREVWGWVYSASGEKLSAAAGLGISQHEAKWTIRNAEVAYEIWSRAGGSWSAWNASRHCWG